jgi:hypothetical protein
MFLVIFVVKMHLWSYFEHKIHILIMFGDKIFMRHVLKLYFEMTILPRKSYCYFDIAVIGMYTRRQ